MLTDWNTYTTSPIIRKPLACGEHSYVCSFSPDPYVQAPTNSQNFNRYSYCLNNPLKYTDPSGEFWHIVAGAIIGSVTGTVMSNINSLRNGDGFWKMQWNGFVAGHIGGAAGAATAATGGAVAGCVGSIGACSGAIVGAAGGAVGGFVGGAGNAWVNGASFKGGLQAGLFEGGIGAVSGGVVGGMVGGIIAARHGGNFWSGNGATFDMVAANPSKSTTVTVGDGMEYTDKYAKTFSDKNFGKVKGVNSLHADGSVPDGYTKAGDLVYNSKGEEINGICIYKGIKNGSDVYLSKSAFVCKEQLYLTMGHEYMHATYNLLGLTNYSKQHSAIYYWEKTQGQLFNYNVAIPNAYRMNYIIPPTYKKYLIPFTNILY